MDIVRTTPRVSRLLVAFGLLLASIIPAVMPALAAAATVTERSVALSSSVKDASSVTYNVEFDTVGAATGAVVVDFCDTAAIGTACTTPSGFSTSGVTTTSTHTVTAINTNKGVKVVLDSSKTAATTVSFDLVGLHNPTAAGALYARIVTYIDGVAPGGGDYNYTSPASLGAHVDDGGVALTITDGFSVNGAVLESLVFCAAESADTIGTGCTGTYDLPGLTLGSGGVLTNTLSEGTIKTQISTNAASGVAVNLKSSTPGGGLARAGELVSDITPITSAGAINIGDGKFGLKLAGLSGVTATSPYDTTTYYLGNATTGTYGDKIYSTAGPVSDGLASLTFGANTSNLTPAGTYSAALNLIATGKF